MYNHLKKPASLAYFVEYKVNLDYLIYKEKIRS